MILYAVVARAKDGVVLVESILAGLEGNHPQVTVELLERIASSSLRASAYAASSSTVKRGRGMPSSTTATTTTAASGDGDEYSPCEILPDGSRRTFVQRDEPLFLEGLFAAAATAAGDWGLCAPSGVASSGDGGASSSAGDCEESDLDYYFHLHRRSGAIYVCLSDDTDVRSHAVNFSFLDDLGDQFSKKYSETRVAKAKAYGIDKAFRIDLAKLMYFYNENSGKMVRQDRVVHLLAAVEDLKLVLGRNLTMVLDRGEALDVLIQKNENMLKDTKVFTKRTRKMNGKVRRKNFYHKAAIFAFGMLVMYFAAATVCGFSFSKCSAREGSPEENDEEGEHRRS